MSDVRGLRIPYGSTLVEARARGVGSELSEGAAAMSYGNRDLGVQDRQEPGIEQQKRRARRFAPETLPWSCAPRVVLGGLGRDGRECRCLACDVHHAASWARVLAANPADVKRT